MFERERLKTAEELNAELYDKFKEFNIIETEVNYSVTCKSGDNKKKEIIISNFNIYFQ